MGEHMKEVYYIKSEVVKEKQNGKIKGKEKIEIKVKDKLKEQNAYKVMAKQLNVSSIELNLEKATIKQDKNKKNYLVYEGKKYIKSGKIFAKTFTEEFLNDVFDEFYRCSFYNYKTVEDYNKIIFLFEDFKDYVLMLPSINLKNGKQLVEIYVFERNRISEYLV